jgi:hypothetical protein
MLHSRRTGTTGTFSTYAEQAAIEKRLFRSSMLWLYCYRKMKEPEQQETVLLSKQKQLSRGWQFEAIF